MLRLVDCLVILVLIEVILFKEVVGVFNVCKGLCNIFIFIFMGVLLSYVLFCCCC